VRQLTDQETFVEHCTGHAANETLSLDALPPRQLCFLAFLPHILDSGAAGRNAYVKVCARA
jgi:protein disulfide-isomerase A6